MDTLTVTEIVDRLGGTKKTAELFGVTPPAVSNWKADNRFPDRMHYRVYLECQKLGIAYDPSGMKAAS